jgi:CBS domain-containing membrane protein
MTTTPSISSPSKGFRVADVMTREVTTIRRNDEVGMADAVMRIGAFRHLPVVSDDDDTRVVGVLSQRDLFRGALARALGYGEHAQDKVLGMLVAKEVMKEPAVTTTPDALLSDAARVMIENKIGCLPVVEAGKLVGILTEGDFVALARGSAA